MNRLNFTITFHSPFRVALGHGGNGAHDAVDIEDALPATSLKGVMRATAKTLLGTRNSVIDEVFGSSATPSPWKWSSARPVGDWHPVKPAARVRIDEETGAASEKMLVLAEQTGAERANFTITRIGRVEPQDLPTHEAVLVVAAQATRSLGAWRRRGMGWVGIDCDREPDEQMVTRFLELKA
ncbi:RAMP superfamily CRISPR-associated protein [Saccharopolyspora shandongensis]|uniref:RAMP superfamily CRISPR-associated protein n=1 Tax=Saccharopolyspora shandongensis TaxID=418495 RepID=UPI0034358A0E